MVFREICFPVVARETGGEVHWWTLKLRSMPVPLPTTSKPQSDYLESWTLRSDIPTYCSSGTRLQWSASISLEELAFLLGVVENIIKIPRLTSKTVEEIDNNVCQIEEFIAALCTWSWLYDGLNPKPRGIKLFFILMSVLNKLFI